MTVMQSTYLRVFSYIPVSFIDCRTDASAVFFLSGCNFRCVYCHNYPQYLFGKKMTLKEIADLLAENWAVGCVKFSGGEPTLHGKNLISAIKLVKEMGFNAAIDTNGSNPQVFKEVLSLGLSEVAIDLKAPRRKYPLVTQAPKNFFEEVLNCIRLARESGVYVEVRTTVAEPLLHLSDLQELLEIIRKLEPNSWVLQVFRPTPTTPAYLKSPPLPQLKEFVHRAVQETGLNIEIRF